MLAISPLSVHRHRQSAPKSPTRLKPHSWLSNGRPLICSVLTVNAYTQHKRPRPRITHILGDARHPPPPRHRPTPSGGLNLNNTSPPPESSLLLAKVRSEEGSEPRSSFPTSPSRQTGSKRAAQPTASSSRADSGGGEPKVLKQSAEDQVSPAYAEVQGPLGPGPLGPCPPPGPGPGPGLLAPGLCRGPGPSGLGPLGPGPSPALGSPTRPRPRPSLNPNLGMGEVQPTWDDQAVHLMRTSERVQAYFGAPNVATTGHKRTKEPQEGRAAGKRPRHTVSRRAEASQPTSFLRFFPAAKP